MTMIIPNKETTLMVTLKNPANMNIPKKAKGKPKATQKANLGLRKRARKISTRIIPCKSIFQEQIDTFDYYHGSITDDGQLEVVIVYY